MIDLDNIRASFEGPSNERFILACALQRPDSLIDIRAKLVEADFLSDNHRALFSVLSKLCTLGVANFDLLSVVSQATETGLLQTIGGADYVNALFNTFVNEANLDTYVNRVLDSSTKYKLYKTTLKLQEDIINNASATSNKNSEDLISSAETSILQVSLDSKRTEDAIDIRAGIRERLQSLADNTSDISGLTTNLPLLDSLINGLGPNSLTVLAARAKAGKSMALMNWASHMAYTLNKPILYIDTEMNRDEVQPRIISHLSQVPERRITTGKFITSERECELIDKACRVMEGGREYMHRFLPGFREDALASLVRKYKARMDIAAFFFDYIKTPDEATLGNTQEYQRLGFLTAMLKDLAGQLNIPVITAAQVNREGVGKSRISENHIGGSDRIIHYCTNLLALSRKTKDEIEKEGGIGQCGTHTLQILVSRHSGSFYEGINLIGNLHKSTFSQAPLQVPNGSAFEDSTWA
jgi:replicative DNA helicase